MTISDVRSNHAEPGVTEYEISFLKLVEKITNGTKVDINLTGTQVKLIPGLIVGGKHTHDCGTRRGIGYFLEPLISLAPFSKTKFKITLTGITNEEKDLTVDTFRTVTLPFLTNFGLEEGIVLKIIKRGARPLGGGEILFKCPFVKKMNPINLVDAGKIARIRGISYCTRVSPSMATRMLNAARDVLLDFSTKVYIYKDPARGKDSGLSPGFGLFLVAESDTNALISVEDVGTAGTVPEEIGKTVANKLLAEILRGGVVDTNNQYYAVLFMALCSEDVSKVRFGKVLTPYTQQLLRHVKEFFGIKFKIKRESNQSIVLSCLGSGFINFAREAL